MPFLLGILRFLLRMALLVSALALAAIGVQGLGADASRGSAVLLLGGSAVLLVVWRKTRARPALKGGRGKAVPATILRIWQDPPAGAPGVYWTYVLFDARGERVQVRLSKRQARTFLVKHSPGDVGRVAWKGAKLVAWQPATAQAPARTSGVSAFVSYERSWRDDARYVAEFLRSRGIDVWIDANELRAGDALEGEVADAIARAHVFVPLLSQSYWTSAWCLRELDQASRKGIAIRPVKVEGGRLLPPPHLRDAAAEILDRAVYVDLRGRDPIRQLDDLAASLSGMR